MPEKRLLDNPQVEFKKVPKLKVSSPCAALDFMKAFKEQT